MNTIQFPKKINLLIAALRPNTPTVKQRFLAYFAPLAVQLKAYFTTIIDLLISVLHTNTLAVMQRFFKFLGPFTVKTQVKLLLFTILSTATVQAQNNNKMLSEYNNIQQTVTRLFIATDQNKWEDLDEVFYEEVNLDYSSMTQQPAATVTPKQIMEQWSAVLPGFESTHHQLGNFVIDQEGATAHCSCYGTATHYLQHSEGNLWTVVGTYDFNLKEINGQ